MSISVIAGPHYLQGPASRPHCWAGSAGIGMQSADPRREQLKWSITDKCEIRSHHWLGCISCCNGPLEMRKCQNFSGCWWGSPPPSCPIKVSLLRLLSQTSTNHQVRNHPNQCREIDYYVFPSLYHKYINYANYEHCILTKTHFLSPFRWYAWRPNSGCCIQLTARNALYFLQSQALPRLLVTVYVSHA